MSFFDTHLEGCTPIKPCHKCVAAKIIKSSVSTSDALVFFRALDDALAAEQSAHETRPSEPPTSLTPDPRFEIPLIKLGLPEWIVRNLATAGIHTTGDAASKTKKQLLEIHDFGRRSLNKLENALTSRNIYFAK